MLCHQWVQEQEVEVILINFVNLMDRLENLEIVIELHKLKFKDFKMN